MKLSELSRLTGAAERQIRFLIAEGFVPAPTGGRARADYGGDHLAAVTRYLRLKELGFPPSAIRLLLDAREGVPLPIVPGITLVIAPDLLGAGGDVTALTAKVQARLEQAMAETRPMASIEQ
jgi:DNA-binding transcriptional MerR regulator